VLDVLHLSRESRSQLILAHETVYPGMVDWVTASST